MLFIGMTTEHTPNQTFLIVSAIIGGYSTQKGSGI
jgi:hypothetical protein